MTAYFPDDLPDGIALLTKLCTLQELIRAITTALGAVS